MENIMKKKIEGTNWVVLPETSIRTTKEYGDTVNLIYQFYIDKKEERQNRNKRMSYEKCIKSLYR